jgi:hypothetical protein
VVSHEENLFQPVRESDGECARMGLAIVLPLVASFCTARTSVCQRLGALAGKSRR